MGTAFSALAILGLALLMMLLLRRQSGARRGQYGPAGISEFRTALAIDQCMDRLDEHSDDDVFQYECIRDRDGSFTLHFTLHQPTRQPVDTLYSLRLDPGRETVVTLIFLREAFGYREPVFQPEMLDEFLSRKLDARRVH